MTRDEFEQAFKLVADPAKTFAGSGWQLVVGQFMYKLPHNALKYIVENENNPFGEWLVEPAKQILSFEDIVLGGKDEHKG